MTTHGTLERVTLRPPAAVRPARVLRLAVPVWAVVAVSLLFAEPTLRLGIRAARTISAGLRPGEWLGLALVAGSLLYAEGYRALQRRFAPAVVARALALGRATSVPIVLLAPLCALGLVRTEPRRLARAWLGVALIVAAAVSVRALPAPWRGIVDGGVSLALLWGLVALWVRFVAAVREESAGSRSRCS